MNVKQQVTPQITVAGQPTEDDLVECKYEGYTAIVNLRGDGEPEQPMSTAAQGEKVRSLGMAYLHHAVGGEPLSKSGVTEVCDFIDRQTADGGKVLVHCRGGGRAKALVLLHQARTRGWSADEALQKGHEAGLKVDGRLLTMVQDYLAENA